MDEPVILAKRSCGEADARPTSAPAPNAAPTNSGRTAVMAAKLIGLNNGVGGRVIAPEQDDAAHRDEDQQEHESEKVKDQPERRNDTTEAKALKEEQHSGEDGHPPEPARQETTLEQEQPCRQKKETAEDVPHAVQRGMPRLDGSPRAFVERSIDSCRSLQPRAVSSA